MQTCFARVAKVTLVMLAVTALVTAGQVKAAEKYWRIDGTSASWTAANIWATTPGGALNSSWVSGDNATFNAVSAVTFANSTLGNVTVNANTAVTAGGTLSTAGTSTFTVADGVTLTWQSQTFSTAAGTGFIKAGNGTWDMSSEGGAYPGPFTLNAGTMIVSKKNSFGAGTLQPQRWHHSIFRHQCFRANLAQYRRQLHLHRHRQ